MVKLNGLVILFAIKINYFTQYYRLLNYTDCKCVVSAIQRVQYLSNDK